MSKRGLRLADDSRIIAKRRLDWTPDLLFNLTNCPFDIIIEISLRLDMPTFAKFAQTSRHFSQLCECDAFWRLKYIKDFGDTDVGYYGPYWKIGYYNRGAVYVMGANLQGRLGLPEYIEEVTVPTRLPRIRAKVIATSECHTGIIDLQGRVWLMGSNEDGQLGHGEEITRSSKPLLLPEDIRAQQISVGQDYTMVLDIHHQVWAFGNSKYGQLGFGEADVSRQPRRLCLSNGLPFLAKHITTGSQHALAIDMNDNVWSWGGNWCGQLGLGDTVSRFVPHMIPDLKAKRLSAGWYTTIITDLDDNIWVCGGNFTGQLYLPEHIEKILVPTRIDAKLREFVGCLNFSMTVDTWGIVKTIGMDSEVSTWSVNIPNVKQVGAQYTKRYVLDTAGAVWHLDDSCEDLEHLTGTEYDALQHKTCTEIHGVENCEAIPNLRADSMVCGDDHMIFTVNHPAVFLPDYGEDVFILDYRDFEAIDKTHIRTFQIEPRFQYVYDGVNAIVSCYDYQDRVLLVRTYLTPTRLRQS